MSLVFWYRQSCCLAGEQVKIVEQQAGFLCQRWLIPRRRVQWVGFAFQYELEQRIPGECVALKVQTTVVFLLQNQVVLKSRAAAQIDELSRRKRDQQCTIPIQFALFINRNRRSSKVCLRFQKEVLDFCWNFNRFIFKIETWSGIRSKIVCIKRFPEELDIGEWNSKGFAQNKKIFCRV